MATHYLKFTGKRTGLAEIPVLGMGRFAKGDIAEVDDETAERWLTAHGDPSGKPASDWIEASEAEIKKYQKAAEEPAEAEEPATVDTAPPAPESASSVKE